jgi:hypothetical protein
MSQQSCQSPCIITIDPALYKGQFTDRNRQTNFPNYGFHTIHISASVLRPLEPDSIGPAIFYWLIGGTVGMVKYMRRMDL